MKHHCDELNYIFIVKNIQCLGEKIFKLPYLLNSHKNYEKYYI